jgi:hypothetical protein
MPGFDQSSQSLPPGDDASLAEDAALEEALKTVPQGALALAGTALGLLMLAWLFVYFFIFLARGPVS